MTQVLPNRRQVEIASPLHGKASLSRRIPFLHFLVAAPDPWRQFTERDAGVYRSSWTVSARIVFY